MCNRSHGGFLGFAALAVLAFSATPSSALPINTSSSTLSDAIGCSSASFCFPGFGIFGLSGAPPVSGSFDITGTTLTFSIDLAAATLTGVDGAVTAVDFSNVNYSGSFSVVVQSATQFSFLDQNATVAGTLTPVGAGSPVAFNISPVNVTGNCFGTPGTSLTCGFEFGSGTPFAIDVNGNPRYFKNMVNVFSVPEPGTALLLGLGLSGLAANRRRSIR